MRKLVNKVKYSFGHREVVTKFLFFPMALPRKDGEYETRWLEKASWEVKVIRVYTVMASPKRKYTWSPVRWID